MAEIVAAALASHAPLITGKPEIARPEQRERLYAGFHEMRRRLAAARPDLLVMFVNDHLQNFPYSNLPAFCIGVVDAYDAYWIMDHRLVVDGEWENLNQLLLDEQSIAACWAWEIFYYGMKIAGTIHNELRLDAPGTPGSAPGVVASAPSPPPEQPEDAPPYDVVGRRRLYMEAVRVPDERVQISGNESFRRTRITRTRAELEACGRQVAEEALEMTSPGLVVYPSPSVANCAPCPYREPCIAVNMGTDEQAILEANYRNRGPEEIVEGRLGGVTWSMNRGARPPKFGP